MSARVAFIPSNIQAYVDRMSVRETPEQRDLREETAALPNAGMQTGADQVALLAMLAQLLGVRRYVEVGVFTGYSALGVALALPADARIYACDVSEHYTSVARRYWQRAGVAERIDLRLAPAAETLRALLDEGFAERIDMAYVDADKTGYDTYYELLLQLLRPNGLIAIDNVLWSGAVLDESDDDADTVALRRLNEKIAADERVECVMLPIGDGLTLARKRDAR